MLALLGTLLSSVLSGGATGLLGILIQRWFDAKNKAQDIEVIKLNHQNAIDLKKLDNERVDKEWAARRDISAEDRAAREFEAAAEERSRAYEADAEMFEASHEADRAKYLDSGAQKKHKWAVFMMASVDWLRGIIRPGLTIYLVAITHVMFNWVRDLADKQGATLNAAEVKDIIMLIISTILYLATVSVVWWFGTRPPKKAADK
ncbi:MAG TPA: hypothetical protein VGE12_10625 [Noviherbaspirillum sp.]